MKRYDTIHSLGNCSVVDFELPEYVTGSYISDKSHFTPVSELAKSVVGQSIGKTDLSRYDFADGTDNGMTVPISRRRPELAEMSVDVRKQQAKIKDMLSKAANVEKFKREVFGEKQGVAANESSSDK